MEALGRPVIVLFVVAVLASTVAFGAFDARKRGKSPWLVGLMILSAFPFGLLVWFVFRPAPVQSGTKASA